jgi:hypothetical protein
VPSVTTLGPLGGSYAELNTADPAVAAAAAAEMEDLGYSTLWLAGNQGNNLPQIRNVVRGTARIAVASGILSVDQVPAGSWSASEVRTARSRSPR